VVTEQDPGRGGGCEKRCGEPTQHQGTWRKKATWLLPGTWGRAERGGVNLKRGKKKNHTKKKRKTPGNQAGGTPRKKKKKQKRERKCTERPPLNLAEKKSRPTKGRDTKIHHGARQGKNLKNHSGGKTAKEGSRGTHNQGRSGESCTDGKRVTSSPGGEKE